MCKRGEKIFLTVAIKQGRAIAAGAWRKHGCNGNPSQWHVDLTVGGGKRLHTGAATGQATATIKRNGHTVRVIRWTRKVTLTT